MLTNQFRNETLKIQHDISSSSLVTETEALSSETSRMKTSIDSQEDDSFKTDSLSDSTDSMKTSLDSDENIAARQSAVPKGKSTPGHAKNQKLQVMSSGFSSQMNQIRKSMAISHRPTSIQQVSRQSKLGFRQNIKQKNKFSSSSQSS